MVDIFIVKGYNFSQRAGRAIADGILPCEESPGSTEQGNG